MFLLPAPPTAARHLAIHTEKKARDTTNHQPTPSQWNRKEKKQIVKGDPPPPKSPIPSSISSFFQRTEPNRSKPKPLLALNKRALPIKGIEAPLHAKGEIRALWIPFSLPSLLRPPETHDRCSLRRPSILPPFISYIRQLHTRGKKPSSSVDTTKAGSDMQEKKRRLWGESD